MSGTEGDETSAKRQRGPDGASAALASAGVKPDGLESVHAEARAGVVDLLESDDDGSSSSSQRETSKTKKKKKKESESDSDSSSSSKKKKSKKGKKERKKLEKAKKKEKKQKKEEKKEAKKQKKQGKKMAEREGLERAKKRLQEEKDALEKETQQRRVALDARISKEAEEEARCKADAAARRFAQRLDTYDTGSCGEADGKKEPAPLRTKKPAKAQAVPTPAATQSEVLASDAVLHGGEATHHAEMPVALKIPKQPDAYAIAAAPSMADAIAEARTSSNRDAEPTPFFASFDTFDAQAAHSKAHPISAQKAAAAAAKEAARREALRRPKPQKVLLPEELFSLQVFPEELKLESEELSVEPGICIAHFVRWALGAWQNSLRSGQGIATAGLTQDTIALFTSTAKLNETSEAVAPLLRQLRRKEMPEEAVMQLLGIVRLAAKRSYASAMSEYADITMGKKTWHQSMSCMQMQQNHGGSIRVIIKQSPLLGFDWDPVVQAYIWALKRLIQFAQVIRPPEISSEQAR